MKKTLLLSFAFVFAFTAYSVPWKTTDRKLTKEQAEALLEMTNDESFQKVLPKNILGDQFYIDMAKEGWTVGEILRLTDQYIAANKAELKKTGAHIEYSKYWRPHYVNSNLMNSTILDYTNPQELEKSKAVVEATQVDPNAYYPRILYTTADRLAGIRNTGYFRHNACMPAGGRIHWIALHPTDPKKMMVIPDSEGIWRTDDGGKTWDCITERIPNRYDRNESDAYSIPVDPDDWNHIFAFMYNSTVYETKDGGQTWRKIIGATHKGFKRGYCFRDAAGNLKFIGAKTTFNNNGVGAQMWISSDTCKNWTSILANSLQKDITQADANGVPTKTFWFQEIAFNPSGRDTLFATGSRRILRSVNAGRTWQSMTFNVYGSTLTGTPRASNVDLFPLATANAPMFININPNNSNEMYVALSTRATPGYTALYKTTDGGANWITLQEPSAGIGSGGIFGNEAAWNWLGGFTVNFADKRYIYGCTMSSAESTDGGVNFVQKYWTDRSSGFYPDGNIYTVSVSSHNADNHVLKSNTSGQVYRGGDAGLIMKDPAVNSYKWTNVSGNLGGMMFYSSTTNEFGDFSIVGNTQDIDAQIYRGGRWGRSRGYEGSTVWMNPFSGEEHYSGSSSGRTDIINQDYGSWSMAWTKADVCTGNWYIRREGTNPDGSRFSVVKNFGKSSIGLDNASTGWVQDFALSRDVPTGKLFILRANKLYYSTNSGTTFTQINTGSLVPTRVAVNPDNSNEIYLAKTGAVYKTTDGGTSWQTISTPALNNISVKSFYYHEGSGDLYFVSADHGIFLCEAGTTDWVLWSKGYNTAKLKDAQINYTTQEMLITDYGSGIWIADLQHPADRYLKNGFALKQISNINGTRTFGIDVSYTIPMYYYFKWYVNGVLQSSENGQYFTTSTLQANDKVKLEVTLRQSPDITTRSAEYTVATESTSIVENKRGNCLYSNQKGRLDLGYVDHFFGNFTIQLWVNPKSDGVILANRQVNTNCVKGFYLSISAGSVRFTYAPEPNFWQPYNETAKTYEFAMNGGAVTLNTWNQVTITHNRNGNIEIYVNGVLKATQARALPAFTLNHSLYLSLFADGYELNAIDASVDEVKIWNEVLDQTTVRKSMYGMVSPANAKLVYYNDFNAATLETQKERFSQKAMAPKMEAVVTVNESALGVCASASDYKVMGTAWTPFANGAATAMEMKSSISTFAPNTQAMFYESGFIGSKTNIPSPYYTVYPTAYGIKMFDVTDFTKTVDVKFYLDAALANQFSGAKVYAMDLNANSESWTALTTLPTYNSTEKSLTLTGVKASDINNKQLVLVIVGASIELTSTSVADGSDLDVYTPDTVKVPFQGALVGGMVAPTGNYNLLASSPIVKKIDPLLFSTNTANSTASVVIVDNDIVNDRTPVTITGQDANLRPFKFTAVNKITAKTIQKGVKLNLGGAVVGNAATFASLSGKNTATFSTWVKLDDVSMLTGYKMLLFFRGTGTNATGLALYNGKVCCHWNDESWSWEDVNTVNSGLSLTTADIGKWVHIAMTASPTGLEFYLNGKKGNSVVRTINPVAITVGMFLGKNVSSDANFIGTFDQVSVWNKTLTQQEIVRYMHQRTLLNETGIVLYLPFDNEIVSGGYTDLKANATVVFNGVVEKNLVSNLPFNYASQQQRTKVLNDGIVKDSVGFTLPATYPSSNAYYTSRFVGVPVNATDTKYPKQVLLEDSYRSISFGAIRDFTASERMQFTVENPSIQAGDSVIFYARSLGSVAAFTTRYSVLAQTGKANFDVPATIFNEALTYLFYRLPRANTGIHDNVVYRYKMTVDNGVCTIQNLRGDAKVSFVDLSGKEVFSKQTKSSTLKVTLDKGAYIVRIEEFGVPCMTKIIL